MSDAPEFLVSMGVTIIIALVTGVPATFALLAVPVVIALQFLFVLWVSLLLSVVYVFVRDLDHIYEVAMRLLFFATPIIYSVSILPPATRRVALMNPLAHLIGFSREIIIEGRVPPVASIGAIAALNVALVYLAIVTFRRAEPAVIEQL
jgi:ABC-type polysaccharide/polyol phosphate export permease